MRRENGNVIYYGYDAVDRLTSEDWYDDGMAPLYGFQWDYDPVGAPGLLLCSGIGGNRVASPQGESRRDATPFR